MRLLASTLVLIALNTTLASAIDWVEIAANGKGFVRSESQRAFYPWGFNYDHDENGKLLEDYWENDWAEVEAAFREMKHLGANVVRIHLQYGKFMASPTQPRQDALDQLSRILKLADSNELYLDITGLGCYHKADVPLWYDQLNEQDRWQTQALFWEAIANTCKDSPAVFCYDLMNEPVVAGGDTKRDDWLGPAFGDKHFVQYIAIDRAGRNRAEVAKKWIDTLVAAIRKHDQRHLITVGLVPWSLDRPGLTSGFDPRKVADSLDFIAVHIYPEQGKLDEAIETLRGFAAVGKPVVIEEIFPLKCNAEELRSFLLHSREYACGWLGFYWGQTPDELRSLNSIPAAMTLAWLKLFQELNLADSSAHPTHP